jgi:hypothetical protein
MYTQEGFRQCYIELFTIVMDVIDQYRMKERPAKVVKLRSSEARASEAWFTVWEPAWIDSTAGNDTGTCDR